MNRIAGSSLLSAFDQEVAQRSTARSWVESQIALAERTISAANTAREAAYTELAEMYAADEGRMAASFGEISQRLQAIFNEKMTRRREVNKLLEQAAGLTANLQGQLPAAQEAEHAAERRLDEAKRVVEAELGADQEFLSIKKDAVELQGAVKQLEAAHARIRAESDAKLAVFNANRLFRYLVARKFGSPDYRASGLIAAGDRWVAQLVAWDKNSPSFATLTELPAFALKRVTEAQKRAELGATKAAFYVSEREVAHGVAAAQTELAAVAQVVKELHAQTAKLEGQRAALVAELQGLDSVADPFQRRAKTEMKAFLTANPVATLRAKAAATPGLRDDELTAQIERAENEINEGRRQVKSLVAERTVAAEQYTRAITARRKFSSDYTGSYDQFNPGVDIGSLLTGYIVGSTTERLLWSSVDHHHYDATPSYSYHSPSSSSDSSSFGSFGGGGDSSGGFSSGGGDSGGSFSTGGGD